MKFLSIIEKPGILVILVLSILVISTCSSDDTKLSGGDLNLSLSSEGYITGLIDQRTNNDFFPENERAPLLALRIDGEFESPSSSQLNKQEHTVLLNYGKSNVQAEVKYEEKGAYIVFELVSLTPREPVELVVWGPYPTTISKTIGETVGVVRNGDFAIGIQSLNIKTLGGFPTNEDDVEPAYDIFATSSLTDIDDSVKVLYRGQTARKTSSGSLIQAYCRDRSKDRVIPVWNHDNYEVPAFDDGGVIGSKIALFGCAEDEVLNTIQQIEIGEGLPHPEIDGEWAKTNPHASASYLIMGFDERTIDRMLTITKKAGLKYLYHGGPFKTWGHFQLFEPGFPDNWASMKNCVERADKEGISLGVHTLSNFITTNDPYVSPVPDKRLAIVGKTTLTKSISADQNSIEIENPDFFNQMKNNSLHAVVVGNEIIRYESVSESKPWTLLNCERGAFNTLSNAHMAGDEIRKLVDHAYKTFLTNQELGDEIAMRLADLFNQTGLKQISFDGLEGNWSTGMGQYGRQLFVQKWYDNLKPELQGKVINDASNPGHFFWHIYTRMNWGEPWYAGFRESQTMYRLMNIDYFRRNYMPAMLGWFRFSAETSIEDVEWLMARSAGYDAGFGLTASPILLSNARGEEALKIISVWEKARLSGAFNEDQKKRMEDIANEFRLETISDNELSLFQFALNRFEHKQIIRQPGEPVSSTFDFENPNHTQELRVIITAPESTSISKLVFELDNYKKVEFLIDLPAKHYLKYSGGSEAVIYTDRWKKIDSLHVDPSKFNLSTGNHKLVFDCTFTDGENSVVKLELKTIDEGEPVIKD